MSVQSTHCSLLLRDLQMQPLELPLPITLILMRTCTKLFSSCFPILSLERTVPPILPNPSAAPHFLFYTQKYYRYNYMWLKCLFALVEPEWMVLYIIHAPVAPGRFIHEPRHPPFSLQDSALPCPP